MKKILLALLLLLGASATAQVIRAEGYAGNTVAAKVTAAAADCQAGVSCYIEISPALGSFTSGTLPTPGAAQTFVDYRTAGSVRFTNATLTFAVPASSSTATVTSATANPALTGVIRLASIDAVSWRNNGNTADLPLAKDSGDRLSFPTSTRFQFNQAAVRVTHSANQSFATAAEGALLWDTETFDTDALHSTVSNTSRLTAPVAGKWYVFANAEWQANAAGIRQIVIRKNAVTNYYASRQINSGSSSLTTQNCGGVVDLAANDYVEVYALQDSGATIVVDGATTVTNFGMVLVGN